MRKTKYLVMMLFVILMILIPATFVNAEEYTFTYGEGDNQITVKKVVTGYTNGDIDFDISNISLSSTGNYAWAVEIGDTTKDSTKWYNLGDFNSSKKTAKITLTTSNKDILALLRARDDVNLFVKDLKGTVDDTSDDEMIINGLQLDLTLPPLYAFTYFEDDKNYRISTENAYERSATYNIFQVSYKFQKITDENLLNNYMQAIKEGKSLSTVFDIKVSDVENVDSWTSCTKDWWDANTYIEKDKLPKDQGAYYLWLKGKDVDSKTVYGCLIVNIDADAPTVKSIQVTDPKEGTYKSGQTVKIRAYFSENITGDSVPTLKIKFGTSPERNLTNGTIKNKYIEYSYDIQDSDVGQLATVSFEGGSIKDATGNSAKLSCPIISGNTIKANVEGTTTTQTDNQDKTENKTNGGSTTTNNGGSTTTNNGGSTTESSTSTNTSNKNIPTGVQTYNGHSYFIFEQKMGWQNAKEYCEAQGGHLVTITSEEEQNFIKSYIQSKKYGNVRFWIGATDKDSEGNWKWVTGEKFEYSNWGKGEPDNLNGDQHYALIQNYNISASLYTIDEYKWDDIASTNLMFICEWDDVNVAKSVNSDSTTATKILPNTGEKTIIFVVISVVIVAGVFAYFYFVKMKDVK